MIVAFPVEQRLGPAPPTNQIVAIAPLSFDRFHPRIYRRSDREKNRAKPLLFGAELSRGNVHFDFFRFSNHIQGIEKNTRSF